MNLTSIKRDCTFIYPFEGVIGFGAEYSSTLATVTANGPPAISPDIARAVLNSTTTVSITAGNSRCFGVFMDPPRKDRYPYRVKACCTFGLGGLNQIVVGYGPAGPTGSDDVITNIKKIPMGTSPFDDIIMVDTADGESAEGLPIFFGVEVDAAAALTTARVRANISVQNLGVSEPTMHFAVP